ncbi:LysM peptidoglycan-binding domain-containing protein [Ferrimonas sediminicola]|uniref:LysM peptidoglycan-binding domain-containing protein n=1 Tax=Ferrimonas sediminicola TaxID=2569538 RepID=A0A4U1BB94_9GAMM|nr:L,D-transpeptidase family protein [Ferrimonas sediminicola]TKB48138.1 LysM peptidoglycan-binding domain-containing protein [Ferrimonas sediminicola]
MSLSLGAAQVSAVSYPLPPEGVRLVGTPQGHTVAPGEHLAPIAEKYGVGLIALMELNPGVDPFLPAPGTKLKLPTYMLLPDAPRQGVVINLAELRLYHFDDQQVHVYPIGIGRIGNDTPLGVTRVTQKTPNPTWTPTASTRAEYLAQGIELPQVVAAGPNNPLGQFALRLGFDQGQYLIHGTNKDFGVGLRVSAGCIRLWPDDIEELFALVKRGEQVRVINQPIKVATGAQGEVMLEVHSPLTSKDGQKQSLTFSLEQLRMMEQNHVNQEWVTEALAEQSGVPKVVGWP